MIFLFYLPLLSSRSCILHVYLIAFCVFNKILLIKKKKFLGVSYEDLEQEVHSLFSEIESRHRSISNPLRRDFSTNLLGAAQKVLENSIIWLAQ
jgi:hypothetical protein